MRFWCGKDIEGLGYIQWFIQKSTHSCRFVEVNNYNVENQQFLYLANRCFEIKTTVWHDHMIEKTGISDVEKA